MAKKMYSGGGTSKSSARSLPGNSSGGNLGKPIGDKGKRSSQGNKMTRLPADRYNY